MDQIILSKKELATELHKCRETKLAIELLKQLNGNIEASIPSDLDDVDQPLLLHAIDCLAKYSDMIQLIGKLR